MSQRGENRPEIPYLGMAIEIGHSLIAALPNPGDPGFPAVTATFMAFFGGAFEYLCGHSWEQVQERAFRTGFVATGFGIAAYLFGLASGLY